MPFEIDRATPMWENYKHDVQTQVVSAFGGVSATDYEVGSNLCPDEKGTESRTPVVSCQWLVKACTDKVQYAQVFASGGMVRVKLCHGAYC